MLGVIVGFCAVLKVAIEEEIEMPEIRIEEKIRRLFQYVFTCPRAINLLPKYRDKVATAHDLSDGDDGCVSVASASS